MSCPRMLKSGFVKRMIQVREKSNAILVSIAKARPMIRAFFLFSVGSFPARIEMKIMLSIPKTISKTVNVSRAMRYCG